MKTKYKYNPNHYVILVNCKEGWQLGFFNNSNIITSVDDKVLCTTNDMLDKCKFFTEVIEIVSNDCYNVGEHVVHKGLQYFAIEVEKIIEQPQSGHDVSSKRVDSDTYRIILGK